MEYNGSSTPAPKTAFVHPMRRDGKHPVTFVFPLSNRSIKKLIEHKDLEAKTAGFAIVYQGR